MPGRRQVSSGSSASAVPMPTMIASLCARSRCTRSRAASPVIASGFRPGAPALPSAEIASLSMTCGRPSRMRRMWPAWSRRASSAPMPTSTAMPAARSRAWPAPATSGLGSSSAETTRETPAAMIASAQGGDFAVMRARLERDVKRRAARRLAGAAQRLDLRMRPPAGLRPAAADNDAVLDDHRADRRIGPGAAEPAPAERERQRHEAGILPQGVRRRAHLRAISAASSPDNSASAVSKSLASRKLR